MSDTPRTDAALIQTDPNAELDVRVRLESLARQLEKELNARGEADQRDAARLAFVIRTDVHLFPNAGPISGAGLFCIYRRKGEEWVNVSGDHADPRKAIDAAMSAQSDKEESK